MFRDYGAGVCYRAVALLAADTAQVRYAHCPTVSQVRFTQASSEDQRRHPGVYGPRLLCAG